MGWTFREKMTNTCQAHFRLYRIRYFARGVSENGGLENVTDNRQRGDLLRLIAEGEKAMAHGEWDVAIDSCIAVMATDPGYLPVHLMLGDVYLASGHVDQALNKYQVVMDTYVATDDPETPRKCAAASCRSTPLTRRSRRGSACYCWKRARLTRPPRLTCGSRTTVCQRGC